MYGTTDFKPDDDWHVDWDGAVKSKSETEIREECVLHIEQDTHKSVLHAERKWHIIVSREGKP